MENLIVMVVFELGLVVGFNKQASLKDDLLLLLHYHPYLNLAFPYKL